MIDITDTKLEDALKKLLQETVDFIINGKVWKSGKIVLFKQSGFFIEFLIQTDKKERFEVPIPFNDKFRFKNNKVVFDYTFTKLTRGNNQILQLIENIDHLKSSKFYDTYMIIRVNEV